MIMYLWNVNIFIRLTAAMYKSRGIYFGSRPAKFPPTFAYVMQLRKVIIARMFKKFCHTHKQAITLHLPILMRASTSSRFPFKHAKCTGLEENDPFTSVLPPLVFPSLLLFWLWLGSAPSCKSPIAIMVWSIMTAWTRASYNSFAVSLEKSTNSMD